MARIFFTSIAVDDYPLFRNVPDFPDRPTKELRDIFRKHRIDDRGDFVRWLTGNGYDDVAADNNATRFLNGKIINGNTGELTEFAFDISERLDFPEKKMAAISLSHKQVRTAKQDEAFLKNRQLHVSKILEGFPLFQEKSGALDKDRQILLDKFHAAKILTRVDLEAALERLGFAPRAAVNAADRFLQADFFGDETGELRNFVEPLATLTDFPLKTLIRIGQRMPKAAPKFLSYDELGLKETCKTIDIMRAFIRVSLHPPTRMQIVDQVCALRPHLDRRKVTEHTYSVAGTPGYPITLVYNTPRPDSFSEIIRAVIAASIAAGDEPLTIREITLRACILAGNPEPSAREITKARSTAKHVATAEKYPYKTRAEIEQTRQLASKKETVEQLGSRLNAASIATVGRAKANLCRFDARLDSALAKAVKRAAPEAERERRVARSEAIRQVLRQVREETLREKENRLQQESEQLLFAAEMAVLKSAESAASFIHQAKEEILLARQRTEREAEQLQLAAELAVLESAECASMAKQKAEELTEMNKSDHVLFQRLLSVFPRVNPHFARMGINAINGIFERISPDYGENWMREKLHELVESGQAYIHKADRLKPIAFVLLDVLHLSRGDAVIFSNSDETSSVHQNHRDGKLIKGFSITRFDHYGSLKIA